MNPNKIIVKVSRGNWFFARLKARSIHKKPDLKGPVFVDIKVKSDYSVLAKNDVNAAFSSVKILLKVAVRSRKSDHSSFIPDFANLQDYTI